MGGAPLSRRRLLKGLAAGTALWSLVPGRARGWTQAGCPAVAGRTVRWIVPFGAGGGFDTYSRLIEPAYERALGAQVVVENVSGAGGLLGSITLMQAPPDGLTQGILNGAALLAGVLFGAPNALDPVRDFSVLGRVARNEHVWVSAANSPLQTLDDVLEAARSRTLVVGVSGVTSTGFLSLALGAHLLDVPLVYVTGYEGSVQEALAVLRGEVDLASASYETYAAQIAAGELTPLLQIGDAPIKDASDLDGVPTLGGPAGAAAARATQRGVEAAEAVDAAAGVAELIGGGRLIAAPPGLAADTFECLESALFAALTDPAFEADAAAAGRSLDVARSADAIRALEAATRKLDAFKPILERESAKAGS